MTFALMDFAEKRANGARRRGVEIARWLVRQNDVRACEHGAGERNPLTFAAAELRRMPLFQPRKSEARNERRKAGGIRAAVVEANRKRDVLGNRERVNEIETLEYDTDVAAAEARRFAVAHFRDFGASDAYGAGIRGDESRKDVEKSRFPGPGRPHHGFKRAAWKREVKSGKNFGERVAGSE